MPGSGARDGTDPEIAADVPGALSGAWHVKLRSFTSRILRRPSTSSGQILCSTRVVQADVSRSAQQYTPWGEIVEGWNNTLPTEYTYTGQREASATGGGYGCWTTARGTMPPGWGGSSRRTPSCRSRGIRRR